MKKTLFLSAILGAALCSNAYATDIPIAQDSGQLNFTTYGADDKLLLNVTGGYFAGDADKTVNTSSAALDVTNLIINQGFSRNNGITQCFTGAVSGSGQIKRTSGQSRQYWIFTGDMSAFTGTITMEGDTNTLTFGAEGGNMTVGASSVSVNGTANNALATVGTVTFTQANITTKKMSISGTTTLGTAAQLGLTNAVTLASGSTLALSDGTTLKLDNMTKGTITFDAVATSGFTNSHTQYTLASGAGSVTREGTQNVTLNGAAQTITWAGDNKTLTTDQEVYLVVSGETKAVSDVNAALATAGVNIIAANGTLTGISATDAAATTTATIIGNGTVRVDGTFQYHNKNFLEDFTGTIEIASGETHIGQQGSKFAHASAIKLLEGGTLKGWSTTFGRAIQLEGGTLSAAGNTMTYSGRVTINSSSTIEGNGGEGTKLTGFVDAKAGVITIKGAVQHNGEFDMSGNRNAYTSSLLIKTGATLTSAGTLWVSNNSTARTVLTLEEGGKLVKNDYTISGQKNGGAIQAGSTGALSMDGNHTLTNVNSVYSGAAATNSNNLAGTTTLKNTGANLLTFTGTIGENATLEGVLGGEDGETSNVKYKAGYGEHQGTIKNVNVENLDAGAYYGSITMDGVYGSLKVGGTQRSITLVGNGLHLTSAGDEVEGKNSYAFVQLSGTGNLEKRFADNQAITIENAADWTGTYANTSDVGTVTFNGNTGASMEGGSVVLKGSEYSGDHISGATVTTNTASKVTISNTLTDVALTANNDVTLTATANSLNSFSGSGALALAGGSSLTVTGGTTAITDLTLGADSTITLGSAAGNHDYELTTSTLTVAGDATINANLVVNDYGTMDFSNHTVLTMGCTVTIGDHVTIMIDDSELAGIVNAGSVMTIIKDVEGVDMNDLALTLGSDWRFVNAQGNSLDAYNLRLDVVSAGDGKVNIVVAPEPATATLSLLALAALASRRRRH